MKFQGEFLGMVASVREQAWGQSKHSRKKTQRCKSTTSQKTAEERETSVTVKQVHINRLPDRKT